MMKVPSISCAAAVTCGLALTCVTMAIEGTMRSDKQSAPNGERITTMTEVTVIIENPAPADGTYLTPVWVGFHDGTFDIYDHGAPASMELERVAEDGNTAPITDAFSASGAGVAQGTLVSDFGIPPIAPGETATMTFMLDGSLASSRYFSYVSMVIPSNDAFVSNGDPFAYRIFNSDGQFAGADFIVLGSEVLDAGTELNDENPDHSAFFGQMNPNTGLDESVVIHDHVGFKFPGSGGILDDPMFSDADFTLQGYQIARISVVAEPDDDDDDDSDDDDDDDD